jgi:putative FmdB family regulatory protein
LPTYEWKCLNEECGKRTDRYQKHIITDEERTLVCPHCGAKAELQIFSPSDIKFCEKGRYIQDRGFSNESEKYNFALKKEREEREAKQNGKV